MDLMTWENLYVTCRWRKPM